MNARVPWEDGSTERTISGAGTYYTKWFEIQEPGDDARQVAGDLVVTGTLVATATLQVSNTPRNIATLSNAIANGSDYTAGGFAMPAINGAGVANFKARPGTRLARFKVVYGSASGTVAFDVTVS